MLIEYFTGVELGDCVYSDIKGRGTVEKIVSKIDGGSWMNVKFDSGVEKVYFTGVVEGEEEQTVFWNDDMLYVPCRLLKFLEEEFKHIRVSKRHIKEVLKEILGVDKLNIKKITPGAAYYDYSYKVSMPKYTIYLDYLKVPNNPLGGENLKFITDIYIDNKKVK